MPHKAIQIFQGKKQTNKRARTLLFERGGPTLYIYIQVNKSLYQKCLEVAKKVYRKYTNIVIGAMKKERQKTFYLDKKKNHFIKSIINKE